MVMAMATMIGEGLMDGNSEVSGIFWNANFGHPRSHHVSLSSLISIHH